MGLIELSSLWSKQIRCETDRPPSTVCCACLQKAGLWTRGCSETGAFVAVHHAVPLNQVGAELGKVEGLVARAEVSLHELSSSTDIEKAACSGPTPGATNGTRRFTGNEPEHPVERTRTRFGNSCVGLLPRDRTVIPMHDRTAGLPTDPRRPITPGLIGSLYGSPTGRVGDPSKEGSGGLHTACVSS